jgi:hypothetical protein
VLELDFWAVSSGGGGGGGTVCVFFPGVWELLRQWGELWAVPLKHTRASCLGYNVGSELVWLKDNVRGELFA